MKNNSGNGTFSARQARGTQGKQGVLVVLAAPPLMVADQILFRLRERINASTGTGQQWYVPLRVTTQPVEDSTIDCAEIAGVDCEHISRIEFDRLLNDKAFVSVRRMNDGNQYGVRKHPLLNQLKKGIHALIRVSIPEIYGIFTFASSCFTNQPLSVRIVSLVPKEHDESKLRKYLATYVDSMQLPSMVREVRSQMDWEKNLLECPGRVVQRIPFSLDDLLKVSDDSYALDGFYDELFGEFLIYTGDVFSGGQIPVS